MSIPGSAAPFLLAQQPQQYQIERSLRFNSSDSAYLGRTPSVAGNRKTWTWAGWVKIGNMPSTYGVFAAGTSSSDYTSIYFQGQTLKVEDYFGGGQYVSAQVFRDPSAWYHVVLSIDTTRATTANRVLLYVNGTLASWGTSANWSQNLDTRINSTYAHVIGALYSHNPTFSPFDGYLADIHFIDGQALDPTSFGEFDANGVWQPKAYTGTYGTNGFHLDFADNSAATTAGIGKDVSGNGNDWTPVNLSVAAGAGNDSLVDTPTNYGDDTGGAGGEVRGNYATWNSNNYSSSFFSDGNLKFAPTSGYNETAKATMAIGDKCYFEVTILSPNTAQNYLAIGLMRQETQVLSGPTAGYNISVGASGNYTGSVAYFPYGGTVNYNGSSIVTGLSTCTVGDVVGISYDPSNGQVKVYKNGVALNSGNAVYTLSTAYSYAPAMTEAATNAYYVNFGQRPFAYPAPSGYKALCTTNLPEPLVAKPSEVMDVKLYTGNGSTQTISGLGFSPDFVWIKGRGASVAHQLFDQVRGVTRPLDSSFNYAENGPSSYGLTAFNSDGFSLNDIASGGYAVNGSPGGLYSGASAAYVAWAWDAGSSTVTNTQGSITSQVRANPSAGFSIVTYTGNGTGGATIGHGLGVAPQFVIIKNRTTANSWQAGHTSIGWLKTLYLNSAAAQSGTSVNFWNNTAPSSSVVTLGTTGENNTVSDSFVAYCFAPIASYSAFGSYVGNGSADGPFVYTGMLPRWIMVKRTDTTGNWTVVDTAREGYNVDNDPLYPNLSNAEGTADLADILSNGFKLRTTDASVNASAGTYVYACFAEAPFQASRAR